MTIHPISRFLVSTDKVCDYLPVLSTATNIMNLFLKCVVLPLKSQASIQSSHYFTHLSQKSFTRCIVLLLPLIGQIAIALYDCTHRKKITLSPTSQPTPRALPAPSAQPTIKPKKPATIKPVYTEEGKALDAIGKNSENLKYVTKELLQTPGFLEKAIARNPRALRFAPVAAQEDVPFLTNVLKATSEVLKYLPDSMRRNKELCAAAVEARIFDALKSFDLRGKGDAAFILEMIGIQPDLDLWKVDPALFDSEDFVEKALKNDSNQIFAFASPRLKAVKEYAIQAVYINPELVRYASDDIRNDIQIGRSVAVRLGACIRHLGPQPRADKTTILAAVKNDTYALQYADPTLFSDQEVVKAAYETNPVSFSMVVATINNATLRKTAHDLYGTL